MLEKTTRFSKEEYFLVSLSILIVNPSFQVSPVFHVLFTFIAFFFIWNKIRFDRFLFLLLLVLVYLLIFQFVKFGNFNFSSAVGLFLSFLFPYFVFKYCKGDIFHTFVNILYVLAVIDLIFWGLGQISPAILEFYEKTSTVLRLDPISNESLIIYNLDRHTYLDMFGIAKNSGFTAEGGVYSCYLILGLILNTKYASTLFDKKNLIFIISLITTQSTAGYIALFIFILGYTLNSKLFIKVFIMPLLLLLLYYSYTSLPFLQHKIMTTSQNEYNVYQQGENVRKGRFNSALVSINVIKDNPLTGRGLYKEDRPLNKEEREWGITGSPVGFINMTLRFGIPFALIYFCFLFGSIKIYLANNYSKSFLFLFSSAAILAVASGQDPFLHPAYMFLVFNFYYKNFENEW
jgi:hypothetical protein